MGAPAHGPQSDLSRYHRQMLLPDFGPEGQARLSEAHAVIVGCGALGCVLGDALARAGVGTLTLLDRDLVDATNLQRQVLFDERDAAEGAPKAVAAARRLSQINSSINLRPLIADLSHRNAEQLILAGQTQPKPPTVLLDGTDNFHTRLLLNDVAVKHSIPLVYAGVVGTVGTSMAVVPGRTPCLRCLVDEPPPAGASPTCDTIGVLGPAVLMIASHQAAQALKILLGRADLLDRTLVELDPWRSVSRRIAADTPATGCPCCTHRRFVCLDGHDAPDSVVLCGRDSVQVSPATTALAPGIDLESLAQRLAAHGSFVVNRFLLRGSLGSERPSRRNGQPLEITVFRDGRAIIRGTSEPSVARSIYARYIGG